MATAADLHRIALALEGTVTAPHFDRTAYKVRRIYATLAADRRTANLKFDPGAQQMACELQPEAFTKIPGGWGEMGWTTVALDRIGVADLEAALTTAWKDATEKRNPRTARSTRRR